MAIIAGNVRIIAGTYRGRTIRAVPGLATRPTTDRIREAWASTVGSLLPNGFEDLVLLDAFAGSGALGIEALSRGARQVVFCERNPKATEVLKKNLSIIDENLQGTSILSGDIFSLRMERILSKAGPFQLVVLDPPYSVSATRIKELLLRFIQARIIADNALVSYERPTQEESDANMSVLLPLDSLTGLKMVSCKSYGTTTIEYLCFRESQ